MKNELQIRQQNHFTQEKRSHWIDGEFTKCILKARNRCDWQEVSVVCVECGGYLLEVANGAELLDAREALANLRKKHFE